jgi:hypothetical protein
MSAGSDRILEAFEVIGADQDCGGLAVAGEHHTVVLVLHAVHQLGKVGLYGGEGQSLRHDQYYSHGCRRRQGFLDPNRSWWSFRITRATEISRLFPPSPF